MYRVLRAFNYSTDGINAHRLEPGMILDILDEYAPGLIEGGFITTASEEPEGDEEEVEEENTSTRRRSGRRK
jgi:hypothetical protein